MGAAWSGENQLITTWYPGNGDEGTQQNLGPRELPSQWEGDWSRVKMARLPAEIVQTAGGSSVRVSAPHVLAEFLETIFRQGRPLRVTWTVLGVTADGSGKKVRIGRARKWEFQYTRITDIAWNINFEWVSRGGRSQKVTSTREDGLASSANALNAAILTASDLVGLEDARKLGKLQGPHIQQPPNFNTLGQLEALANAPGKLLKDITRKINKTLNGVRRVLDLVRKVRNLPGELANTAVDFARNSMAEVNQFNDELSRTPPELKSTKTKVRDIVRAYRYFGQTSDAMTIVGRRSLELERKMRPLRHARPGTDTVSRTRETGRVSDVLAIYKTRQGDTPMKLSLRYYRTSDHAADILKANRLPLHTPTFDPGKILIIPALTDATRL